MSSVGFYACWLPLKIIQYCIQCSEINHSVYAEREYQKISSDHDFTTRFFFRFTFAVYNTSKTARVFSFEKQREYSFSYILNRPAALMLW